MFNLRATKVQTKSQSFHPEHLGFLRNEDDKFKVQRSCSTKVRRLSTDGNSKEKRIATKVPQFCLFNFEGASLNTQAQLRPKLT